jgi:hypothetical protein
VAFEKAVRPTHRPFMPILADFLHITFSVMNVATKPSSMTVSRWNDAIPVAMGPGVGLIFDSHIE